MVEKPIRKSDNISVDLRPSRSPKWPNSTAPSGRANRPVANAPNDASVALVGSRLGKNCRLNTSAAAVPYAMKSKPSIMEPAVADATAL